MTFLYRLSRLIDGFSMVTGKAIAWLAIAMVLVQFAVVMMRYVYGISFIWMQESITYMHALLFMVGAGYTLLMDGHVRVDVFYREAGQRKQARIDLLGAIFFLIPFSILIIDVSWGYVVNSWAVHEGSKETSGIQAIFLLKSVIPLFAVLLILQALSIIARSLLVLSGRGDLFETHKEQAP
ncbi:TRAP transporter small permease subunit [Rhodospirillum sp. A1_3_36]|uniref:TRAP transporter small permease subunit n=1 Tax=Rhodospirillum sp. A1_3_36 TaxID=3391666 RepID=UPI0039A5E0A9